MLAITTTSVEFQVVRFPGQSSWRSVSDRASYSEALGGQECYVVAQNLSTGGIQEVHGVINSDLFHRAAVLGTGYTWEKIEKQSNAFLLWHTADVMAPADGTSGLC